MSSRFPILYEDNHIVVAVKPQNVPSQSDDTGDLSFQDMVREYIRDKYNKPGNVYTGLVHRLDRPAGGVMVFARTSKAASRLSKELAEHRLRKVYYAVLGGNVYDLPDSGTLEDWLCKDRAHNTSRVCRETTPGAKFARLDYQVLDRRDGLALVRIELQTGRSHQIRVQFASRGTPLVGDYRYGGIKGTALCLWSGELSLVHPTRKEEMTFRAPPPDEAPWSLFHFPKPQQASGSQPAGSAGSS